jgi:hypothetical protein
MASDPASLSPAVEAYLAALDGAAPDMGELHRLGVPLQEAVAICESHHKAPEPAPVAKPAPKPVAVKATSAPLNLTCYVAPPAPAASELDAESAASQLHDLLQEIERGRPADVTALVRAGWSASTARELVKIINISKQRTVKS